MISAVRPRHAALITTLLIIVIAGIVLVLQVRVHEGGIAAACGAPFDVISGRGDWQTWYAEDLNDPRLGAQPSTLIRTEGCPAAVNRRTAVAGGLGVVAVLFGAATAILTGRSRVRTGPTSLGTLGAWVTGVGVVLTLAGFVALIVLLANPSATLFLYVDRWVVATVGSIVLIPAIALAAGGRALMLVARQSDERRRNS